MIKNKKDYKYYLEADRISLGRDKTSSIRNKLIRLFILPDYVWEFQKLLRKVEYLTNKKRTIFDTFNLAIQYRKLNSLSMKLGYYIHPNNFGPGLSISHPGTIVINEKARIGANCRIHPCTVIGTQAGFSDKAAHIGNNVYIGPGAKIFGQIDIADGIAIGANSVVNKSFAETGITIAGVPAVKVSNKGSEGLVIKGTEPLNHTNNR
jgi:serine O-acetyltransferase